MSSIKLMDELWFEVCTKTQRVDNIMEKIIGFLLSVGGELVVLTISIQLSASFWDKQ